MGWDKIGNLSSMQVASNASTVAIGTSATATGLSLPVVTGTYRIVAYLPIVNVGSPTNTLVSVSGPAVLGGGWPGVITRFVGTGSSSATNCTTTAGGGLSWTTSTTVAGVTAAAVEGSVRFSAAGTVSVSLTRTGGTSQTLQVGAFLQLIRIS